jgi:hypothetical protein
MFLMKDQCVTSYGLILMKNLAGVFLLEELVIYLVKMLRSNFYKKMGLKLLQELIN